MHSLAQTQQVFTHSKSTMEAVEHSTKSMLKEQSMLKSKKRHQSDVSDVCCSIYQLWALESLLLTLYKQMLDGKIVLYFLCASRVLKVTI